VHDSIATGCVYWNRFVVSISNRIRLNVAFSVYKSILNKKKVKEPIIQRSPISFIAVAVSNITDTIKDGHF